MAASTHQSRTWTRSTTPQSGLSTIQLPPRANHPALTVNLDVGRQIYFFNLPSFHFIRVQNSTYPLPSPISIPLQYYHYIPPCAIRCLLTVPLPQTNYEQSLILNICMRGALFSLYPGRHTTSNTNPYRFTRTMFSAVLSSAEPQASPERCSRQTHTTRQSAACLVCLTRSHRFNTGVNRSDESDFS